MHRSHHIIRRLLLALLVAAGLLACQAVQPRPQPNETRALGGSGLLERQPADIALAPLRDQTAAQQAPLELLRECFYEGLIRRLYSPLELAYVDKHWVESSFAGAPPPDALLVVSVTEWDTSTLTSNGRLQAGLEMRLYEGGSPNSPMLWGALVRRRVDLELRQNQAGLLRELLPRAVQELTNEALGELPERDPVAAAGR